MPVKACNLYEDICSFAALHAAAHCAVRGKRKKPGAAGFMARLENNLVRLQESLEHGNWRPGAYTVIDLKDPKPRCVSAAPFADRVVHHALCAVIGPIFERSFIFDSYANRLGKGSHAAICRYEQYRDRHAHVLRGDIYRYFPAIDHRLLKAAFRRHIACPRTLTLMDLIVDGSNLQEPVPILYPGDDLLTVAERRQGLPIGNLTSQLFGNVFLNGLDHFVKEVLRATYVRYMDDFALFHDDPLVLERWQIQISAYLQGRRLTLHPRKTWIGSSQAATVFLGFELLAGGWRRLPTDNVDRFVGRLQSLRARWRAGTVTDEEVRQRVSAWIAHARHAHTESLRHALFRGSWFDPLWSDGSTAFPQAMSTR